MDETEKRLWNLGDKVYRIKHEETDGYYLVEPMVLIAKITTEQTGWSTKLEEWRFRGANSSMVTYSVAKINALLRGELDRDDALWFVYLKDALKNIEEQERE